MSFNLKTRLEELKTLNKSKEKFNKKIKSQLLNEQIITESLTTFHKPVTEKLTKNVAIPENTSTSKPIEENMMKYQPLELLDKNINPQLTAKSLVPQFQNKILKGITFDSIILNEKEFLLFKEGNIPYIFLYETSPEKFSQNRYPFTTGLENLIKGYIKDETKQDMENYIRILNSVKGSTNSKYYKDIVQKIKKYNEPIIQEGKGINDIIYLSKRINIYNL